MKMILDARIDDQSFELLHICSCVSRAELCPIPGTGTLNSKNHQICTTYKPQCDLLWMSSIV